MNKLKEFLTKVNIKLILIILFIILVLYFIISSFVNGANKRACNELRTEILSKTDSYFSENNLLPSLNGVNKTIELSSLNDSITFKDKKVTGTVTYTKYNDTYIKTLNLDNASYCSTKEFKKESDNYDEEKNAKVVTTFNYFEVDSYNSKWTGWYPSEKISTTETNGVLLPLDEDDLPDIANNAVITEYVRETKTYYSYRDKQWKWYKNDIKYSDYSSTQPSGYTNKDTQTKTTTEPTKWSLNYPEEFDYRHISSKTGYRWYYMDGKEKKYWNNGEYSVESPGEEYEKEKESSAKMYSYYDDVWRWYNGDTKRVYSSYQSKKPSGYNYKDDSTLRYTSWSSFTDESKIDDTNKNYREEQTDTYSRYLIKFDVYSLPILDNYVTLEELENKLGKSYEEINADKSIKVDVKFKFIYE